MSYSARIFLIGVLVACAPSSAFAGFFKSVLFGDQVSHLQDEDREILLTREKGVSAAELGVAQFIDVQNFDNYLVGTFKLESYGIAGTTPLTNLPTPDGENITGVFVTKIVTEQILPSNPFVPPGGKDYTHFYGLAPAEEDVWDWLGLSRNDLGTMVSFWENLSGGEPEIFDADGVSLSPVKASLQSAERDNLVLEVGFTGTDPLTGKPAAGANEFWSAQSTSADTLAVSANDVLFSAALGLTFNPNPLVIFTPHDHLGFGAETIAQLSGRVKEPASLDKSLPVNTDTDFFIRGQVVPEPGTLAIWGLFAVLGIGSVHKLRD